MYKELAIEEKVLTPDNPSIANPLNNLAGIYYAEKKYSDAEPLYKRSLAIVEKSLGPTHPSVGVILANYADLMKATGRTEEADKMVARANQIKNSHH